MTTQTRRVFALARWAAKNRPLKHPPNKKNRYENTRKGMLYAVDMVEKTTPAILDPDRKEDVRRVVSAMAPCFDTLPIPSRHTSRAPTQTELFNAARAVIRMINAM